MSDTQTTGDDRGNAPPDGDDEATIAAARRMGWKPRDEYTRSPDKWKPAKEFLETGFGSPAVLAERYQDLDDRYAALHSTSRQTEQKLGEAVSTIGELTTMMRASEKRAYDRARRELQTERDKAVELGDKESFKRLDGELEEMARTAPAEPVQRQAAPAPTGPNGAPLPPAVTDFYNRNPWYMQNRDLQIEADIIHTGLRNARPDLSLDQNLAEVERRMRQQFPEQVGGRRAAPTTRQTDDDNPRRDDPAAVAPSSGGAPRRTQQRFTFDGMPKDAKDAYQRYAKMLEGKGAPLTKEEYAKDYWAQFQDDGT